MILAILNKMLGRYYSVFWLCCFLLKQEMLVGWCIS